jgi:glycosyltransferase involved in cell wall biosynthesis
MSSPWISVTVPVYNEAKTLISLHDQLLPVLQGLEREWEIILVNDGSTDDSAQILDDLANKDTRLKVIHFRRNAGQTAAMMAGLDYARGEIIVPMDADLQNDPIDIPRLLEKLGEGYDVCSGWRKDRQDHSLRRNLPSRVANWIISRVSGVHLHDYGCSLKAYRREVIKGVRLYGEMHRFIPIYASWLGARVTEIPVQHHPRLAGTSNYGLERIFKVVLDLIVVKFLDRYEQKPMHIFGGVGLINFLVSFLAGLMALWLKFWHGTSFILTPLPLLVVFSAITGVMCILMGLLAELTTRTMHESRARPTYVVGSLRNLKKL